MELITQLVEFKLKRNHLLHVKPLNLKEELLEDSQGKINRVNLSGVETSDASDSI